MVGIQNPILYQIFIIGCKNQSLFNNFGFESIIYNLNLKIDRSLPTRTSKISKTIPKV